jgi:hypothetical protein
MIKEHVKEKYSKHWAATPGMRQSNLFIIKGLWINSLKAYRPWAGNNVHQ